MRSIKQITLTCLMLLSLSGKAQVKEIPFTLDDRDRIIRTEQKVDALDAKLDSKVDALDAKFDSKVDALDAKLDSKVEALNSKIDSKFDGLRSEMNARFDQLFNFLWVLVGIFSAMLATVFGFAFWDRKISVAPMKRENARIIESLREFSLHNPKLREILKNAGLL
jgi:hypothetical protein